MYTFVLALFIIVCISLVIAILLQSSKGEGLASTFGGSGGGAVFGQKATASFLSKATTWLASGFMINKPRKFFKNNKAYYQAKAFQNQSKIRLNNQSRF
jgi:protein translocase SecG subunit